MLSEREVHSDVRTMLFNNEPFQYAHLIKFERPSRPDGVTGKVSTSAHRYTYITDASRDVAWDDGSVDHNGVANGSQTYIANKLLNVSSVQEATEARASNFSITLDGNGIGAVIPATSITMTNPVGVYLDFTLPASVDAVYAGFREGDKVYINATAGGVGYANIDSFRANNVMRVKPDPAYSFTPGTYVTSFELSSEEIKSILLNKQASDYASFINREVYIYRAYFKEGTMVGGSVDGSGNRGPILIFKGIISNVSFDDDENGVRVQWGLTSHWGDFAQVRGRITSDDFHRALDHNGIPQPSSAIKPVYAFDKGFMHSETSINLLAQYSVQVEKQDVKAKSGFLGLGIGAKVKVKKYFVSETRNTNLDFQLAAKSIPVIYGVRSIPGIPIFADTLNNDSSTIYVIYALSEGPIGGIYDIYINGKSLICNNESDYDVRHAQNTEETIDVLCRGRADRGDVLGGVASVNSAPEEAIDYYDEYAYWESMARAYNPGMYRYYQPYIPPTTAPTNTTGAGIIHEQSISLDSPISMTLDFFCGTEGQRAASKLVEIAKNNGFKVQNDYWMGTDTAEYWGPNHRLVDTAYVLATYKIKEGETTIPELEFIVRGKSINCYNYDYSYAHDDKMGSESPNNFALGQVVSLYRSDTNGLINASVQIIDKWTSVRRDGVQETRFRFSQPPALNYDDGVPGIKRFHMSDGANTWTMTTFNYELHSGVVPSNQNISVTEEQGVDGNLVLDTSTPVGGDPSQGTPIYSLIDPDNPANNDALVFGRFVGGKIDTLYSYDIWDNR